MKEASRKFRRLCKKSGGHYWHPQPLDGVYFCAECGQRGAVEPEGFQG